MRSLLGRQERIAEAYYLYLQGGDVTRYCKIYGVGMFLILRNDISILLKGWG